MLVAHWRLRCSIVACIRNWKSSRCRMSPREDELRMSSGLGNSLRSTSAATVCQHLTTSNTTNYMTWAQHTTTETYVLAASVHHRKPYVAPHYQSWSDKKSHFPSFGPHLHIIPHVHPFSPLPFLFSLSSFHLPSYSLRSRPSYGSRKRCELPSGFWGPAKTDFGAFSVKIPGIWLQQF